MTESDVTAAPFSGRTRWVRRVRGPAWVFLRTETGSAVILVIATVAALLWANIDPSGYQRIWATELQIRLGGSAVSLDLRGWVNSGLMTFFFLIVGLEARREFDTGELRERRRLTLPLIAGIAGLAVPVAIYLAINAGQPSAQGWGAAMSTDTAFALGILALVGPRFSDRLRGFMLTVLVVDDLIALAVIAVFYSEHIVVPALLVALGVFAVIIVIRSCRIRYGIVYAVLGAAAWLALLFSGIDPVVAGLALGLLTYAYPSPRANLERATERFRLFREQPTPELARSARIGLGSAISPNERLQLIYQPLTSYVIVPLFALANAGITLSGDFLGRALVSPITLGILVGYVVGKPIGIVGASWLVTRLSRGRLRPPVGWAGVLGAGTIAGIGFTLSLLIATLAFTGDDLEEAKLGVLSAAVVASVLTWVVFQVTARLPHRLKIRALLGTAEAIVDLADAVDTERDHVRGPHVAPVTLVEYGDFECPYCGQAEPVVRELLSDFGDLRYVWRHLPLTDVHPSAQQAAQAAEAANAQGEFWGMHDLLLAHQGELRVPDLVRYAAELDLDVDRFVEELGSEAVAERVAEDVESADLSGVTGTPTFFVNGRRHQGAYDVEALSTAVRAARARATIAD